MTALSAQRIAEILGRHAPTAEQAAVIEAPLEPLLVVAGAGSGKTETMASRVVHLIANDVVAPERVLGLTFTRKAAAELSERVRSRLRALRRARGQDGARSALTLPTISTYNSYAAGLVGDHALRIGLEPSARLLGEAARWQLAHGLVEQWADDLEVDLAPSTVTAAVLDLAGALAEHLLTPAQLRSEAERLVDAIARTTTTVPTTAKRRTLVQDVQRSLRLRARLVDLVEAFTERKRAMDAIDFADQVALAARLAREVPEVGAGERARYGVVLLDEYQDTSVAQLQLLRDLYGSGAGDGLGHPVTAVGDPHQAIYGWRGASAGGLARFPEHFPPAPGATSPSTRVLALATSWRNDAAVLAAANTVAAPLRAAAGLDLPLLAPRPGAGPGHVHATYLETLEDEARAVAAFVRDHRDRALTAGDPVPTAAVLCRRRSQFPVLQAALLGEGLPVEVVGLGGLLSTPEVVDLVAALQCAHDPARGDALMRLLTGPRARLGLADLHALSDRATELAGPRPVRDPRGEDGPAPDVVDERSIVDALDDLPPHGWVSPRGRSLSPAGHQRLTDLAGVLRALREQTFLPVVDLVAEAERLLDLDIEVAARPGTHQATSRVNLDAFRSVAASFGDADEHGTLGAFLAWLDAAQREERGLEAPVAEMDPAAVQLLTVHAAKGLEWDVVAVPGLVDKTFPGAPRTTGWIKDRGAVPTSLRGDRESLPDVDLTPGLEVADLAERLEAYTAAHAAHHHQEERRLAYVALTRARTHLMLSGSWWREGTRPTEPSVFLTELTAGASPDGEPVLALTMDVPDPREVDDEGRPRHAAKPEPEATAPPTWPPADLGRPGRLAAARAVAKARMHPTPPVDEGTDAAGTGSGVGRLVDLLLAERDRAAGERATVALPAHLSASALVRLARDRDAFALQLRRPVPLPPSTRARRGTLFHAWVESYYGSAALVDVDGLPGAEDETALPDADLAAMRTAFLDSEWAGRTPVAVEVDIETPVGDVMVRSRIDAVFADSEGRVTVVDWKTGPVPHGPGQDHRDLQLAVYRLAWSRAAGVPVEQVDAAFVHVGGGTVQTVRPQRLLGESEIESLLAASGSVASGADSSPVSSSGSGPSDSS